MKMILFKIKKPLSTLLMLSLVLLVMTACGANPDETTTALTTSDTTGMSQTSASTDPTTAATSVATTTTADSTTTETTAAATTGATTAVTPTTEATTTNATTKASTTTATTTAATTAATTSAATTTATTATTEKTFTLAELAKYDGLNGQPAYVAVEGIVYDVSSMSQWSGGSHEGYQAGTDLTDLMASAPHSSSVLSKATRVGVLVP